MPFNILFALYNDFSANSASHVHSLSNELVALGNECCVAVPFNKASLTNLGPARFRAIEFEEPWETGLMFSDGRGPDIVHAWTPRENVRRFCEQVRQNYGSRLFVHMEDNEWHLLSSIVGMPFRKIAALLPEEMDTTVPPNLSHPLRAIDFLKSADGVTIIIDRLSEFVPAGKPVLELWPSAQRSFFGPQPRRDVERRALGIANNSTVLAYTGNVHAANAHEVRSLYLAVAVLNREGHPATLVRAGRDYYPFLGPGENWGYRNSIELGPIPHTEIPMLLGLADVLVQPGRADEFNDYRLPSKIPEFLSIGRPVILPNTNIARHMVHGTHAYILPQSNGLAIAEAVREVTSNPELYRRLSEGALEFFNAHLSWEKSARKLNDFYIQQLKDAVDKHYFIAEASRVS